MLISDHCDIEKGMPTLSRDVKTVWTELGPQQKHSQVLEFWMLFLHTPEKWPAGPPTKVVNSPGILI